MRATEFLLEYKRDITFKNFRERLWLQLTNDPRERKGPGSLHDSWYKHTENGENGISNEHLDAKVDKMLVDYIIKIESADPTPNKQYTQWLVRAYINDILPMFEDVLSNGAEFLSMFHDLKIRKKLPPDMSDINQLKTIQQYREWKSETRRLYDMYSLKAKLPKGKYKTIADDSEISVYIPLDQDAACYLGQNTDWCTAVTGRDGRTNNYFNTYNKLGPLFIVIPKQPKYKGEKYQLHLADQMYMDKDDDSVELIMLIETWPQLHKILHPYAVESGVKSLLSLKPGVLENYDEVVLSIKSILADNMSTPEKLLQWANTTSTKI